MWGLIEFYRNNLNLSNYYKEKYYYKSYYYSPAYLIQQIEFRRRVAAVASVLDQERYQLDERIAHAIVLLPFRGRGRRVQSLLTQLLVNVLNAHLCRDAEETGDHVVGFQYPIHVHAVNIEVEILCNLDLGERAEQDTAPLAEQVLGLLLQAGRVVVVAGLDKTKFNLYL